jgi:peptidylprolyl isomerase
MRFASLTATAAAMLLSGCVEIGGPPARPAPVQPARAPLTGVTEPSQVIASAPAEAWRPIAPENLLLMELGDGSRVAIELAPQFAPVHVANIRAFARSGWWDDASIYRVQDNYVVQWGVGDSDKGLPQGVAAAPPAEYDRAMAGLNIRALGYSDPYAPSAGYSEGWPVGYDPQAGRAWLAHCYGVVGAGRDLETFGTSSELYAVIGHAPRHLDLNIATVGRVIEGMEALTARQRGSGPLGFIEDAAKHVPIKRVRLAADLPEAERPQFEVMRTDTDHFARYITGRANRGGDFFKRPAGGVDLCNALVPVRRRPA